MDFSGFSLWPAVGCILAGYLLGNIQTAIIVSKAYFHDDVRRHGSHNAGSTNMVRVFGWTPGAITFAGDFCKAVAGYFIGTLLMGTLGGYLAGLCVIVGHCYPVFTGFAGGKGVASSCGLAFCVFPLGMAIALAGGVAVVLFTKKVSLMSLAGITLLLALTLIFRMDNAPLLLLIALMTAIIYIRHIENIKRLLHGEETPLKPKSGADADERR